MAKFLSRAGSNIDHLQTRLLNNNHDDYRPLRPSPFNPERQLSHSKVKTIKQEDNKLGTFEGVYLQVVLNIWGVILFLRLGYILSQVGYLITLAFFAAGYLITTFTSLSISAISTNGTVRGGGPYYMISRSLGPEFGGSIGIIVYLGICLNAVLNALASVEGIVEFFGKEHGTLIKWLPEGQWWLLLYGSIVLLISISICFMGSKIVAKASLIFSIILLISTLSIFFSFLIQPPFIDSEKSVIYTSFSWDTLRSNLYPKLYPNENGTMETYQSIFSVLFPACIGIMAGASMSGDLKDPSRSIPKGTLWAILTTFIAYILLLTMFAATVSRDTLIADINVMSHIGLYPPLVNVGVLATSISSSFSCLVGASKILQALARDHLIPGFYPFGYGSPVGDEPIIGFLLTYALAQLFLFAGEMNLVAGIVTMFFVLTFGVTNLACFLLKVGGAPNFRPSFKYFKGWTAFVGFLLCFSTMFYVSPMQATLSTTFASFIFALVHFTTPPKAWGDVTQSLIYHQVRKYLLRLDTRKEHVKFWRPQILLLINDPRQQYQLMLFCNYLKKGSLFIIGHILKGELREQLMEMKKQKLSFMKLIDIMKMKAFIQLDVAKNEMLAARSILLGAGLGGMVPNIVVLGQFNLNHYRRRSNSGIGMETEDEDNEEIDTFEQIFKQQYEQFKIGDRLGPLPTDEMKSELPISIMDYVSIIEDSLLLNKAVAIAFGFQENPLLPCLPKELQNYQSNFKKYIDLWPIQMVNCNEHNTNQAINFDSYTMVLQLGCILHMVPQWKERYELRVNCFVEHKVDVEEEKSRVNKLLLNLRIPAQLNVFYLDEQAVPEYDKLFGENQQNYRTNEPIEFDKNKNEESQNKQQAFSTSLRINLPLPDGYDQTFDTNNHTEDECSDKDSENASDEMSDFLIDLDLVEEPIMYHQPHETAKEFNELPVHLQYSILNQLILLNSNQTAIVFSTLPAPDLNCSKKENHCLNYCQSLEQFTKNLPPTILVHAKSLTVTTSL
ncbi:hypothetical protein K502DRAFT_326021 [Neoconidiobolus thromboides FSU 785]|nr:hypothetical protein K502DRAFT_326021 [Neoconidiobolus thromboides FSU 785]